MKQTLHMARGKRRRDEISKKSSGEKQQKHESNVFPAFPAVFCCGPDAIEAAAAPGSFPAYNPTNTGAGVPDQVEPRPTSSHLRRRAEVSVAVTLNGARGSKLC